MYLKSLVFIILFLGLVRFSWSQNPKKEIDKYLDQRTSFLDFSGSVLVIKNGKTLLHKGYGMADYENQIPNTLNTVHRIGSLTKQFTSMAIMILVQEGKIQLDDKINQYIKTIPPKWSDITIHHLLSHTSGVPELFGDLESVPVEKTGEEIERVFELKKESEPRANPGEAYRYSNYGYVLLGYLIEKVSGKIYPEFLKEKILDPLQMSATYYDDSRPIIPKRAEGYQMRNKKLSNDKLTDPAAFSAGGMLSSTSDYEKFIRELFSNTLLDKNHFEKLFQVVQSNYAYGWQVLQRKDKSIYAHSGGTHGFSSKIIIYPKDQTAILILGNNASNDTQSLACDIESILLDDLEITPFFNGKKSSIDYTSFNGMYKDEDGNERGLKVKEGEVYYVVGTENELKLNELAPYEFSVDVSNYARIVISQSKENPGFTFSRCGASPIFYQKASNK